MKEPFPYSLGWSPVLSSLLSLYSKPIFLRPPSSQNLPPPGLRQSSSLGGSAVATLAERRLRQTPSLAHWTRPQCLNPVVDSEGRRRGGRGRRSSQERRVRVRSRGRGGSISGSTEISKNDIRKGVEGQRGNQVQTSSREEEA